MKFRNVCFMYEFDAIKNITYIQDTREKHNPSLAVGNKIVILKQNAICKDDARTHKPIKGTPPHTPHFKIESYVLATKSKLFNL